MGAVMTAAIITVIMIATSGRSCANAAGNFAVPTVAANIAGSCANVGVKSPVPVMTTVMIGMIAAIGAVTTATAEEASRTQPASPSPPVRVVMLGTSLRFERSAIMAFFFSTPAGADAAPARHDLILSRAAASRQAELRRERNRSARQAALRWLGVDRMNRPALFAQRQVVRREDR